MIPGPTVVLKCPACGGMHQQLTFVSGNSFGARHWTDGKIDAPMYPVPTRFARCEHCHAFFFTEDAGSVGEIPYGTETGDVSEEWRNAPRLLWPHIEDYRDALAAHADGGDPERERYLRTHLWWSLNDALTGRMLPSFKDPQMDAKLDTKTRNVYRKLFFDNLHRLLKLAGGSGIKDRVLKAEALRELGSFDKALQALTDVNTSEQTILVETIRARAEAHDDKVAELPLA